MGVDSRLAPGEEVYQHLHPHAKALVLPVVVLVLCAGVGAFLAAMAPVPALRYVVVAAAFACVLVWTLRPFLRWWTTTYTLTDRRILIREGVLSRTGRDIPLGRVSDVAFRNTLWQRMLRCGTLLIESAGEQGQVTLANVPKVEAVQRDIYLLIDADASERPQSAPGQH